MDMNSDFTPLGRRLRRLRKEKKITTKQLSNECGISDVYLRQIEGQGRLPSLDLFITICNKLGTNPTYLLQDFLENPGSAASNPLATQFEQLSPQQQFKASKILHVIFEEGEGAGVRAEQEGS